MNGETYREGPGLSVRDAARTLGISESGVRKALAAGRLDGAQVGRRWIVSAESVSRYQSLQVTHAPEGRDAIGNGPGTGGDAVHALALQLAAAIERAVRAEAELEDLRRSLESGGSGDTGPALESPQIAPQRVGFWTWLRNL